MLEIFYQNGRYKVLWEGTDLSAEITAIDFCQFKSGVIPEIQLTVHPQQLEMHLETKHVNVRVPNGKTQQAQGSP